MMGEVLNRKVRDIRDGENMLHVFEKFLVEYLGVWLQRRFQ